MACEFDPALARTGRYLNDEALFQRGAGIDLFLTYLQGIGIYGDGQWKKSGDSFIHS